MMSAPDDSAPALPSRGKSDDDDHDLLTFSEAGERLRLEIATLQAQLAELEASGDVDAVQRAKTRLTALIAAAARNTAQPINDANFEKFFGYPGNARRNPPGPTEAGR